MEKVWINKGNPECVIEKDDVHYFYFPIELGIGKIRIGAIKIPLPINFPDYEPIKVVQFKGRTQVISRFHYEILTYFNNPKLIQNRAIVDFYFGSHSPYVHSKEGPSLGTKIALSRLGAIETQFVRFLIMAFTEIVSGRVRIAPDDLTDYDLEKRAVPKETIFHPRKCHSIVWVGTFPEKKHTPPEVWNVLED